ncbi:unnamed protein product [Schistocephalus solidus]|uniref:Reverse transcriptase domain-containing protein n=1 Tax=Schistocephalus solidus TaxID=70667 RepID=A0A183SZL3_SCHSO|nr:unnamed protein product [Schistocephalus solidus]
MMKNTAYDVKTRPRRTSSFSKQTSSKNREDGLPISLATGYPARPRVVDSGPAFSEAFDIWSGVQQGCILSPILFKYAIDWILGKALHEEDGVELAPGRRLVDLDYADDITLLAANLGNLKSMVSQVNEVAKSVGLSINAGKTKVFSSCISAQEKAPLEINGCQREEIRIYRASVRSILLYGCECWPTRIEDELKLEAFDHHCFVAHLTSSVLLPLNRLHYPVGDVEEGVSSKPGSIR